MPKEDEFSLDSLLGMEEIDSLLLSLSSSSSSLLTVEKRTNTDSKRRLELYKIPGSMRKQFIESHHLSNSSTTMEKAKKKQKKEEVVVVVDDDDQKASSSSSSSISSSSAATTTSKTKSLIDEAQIEGVLLSSKLVHALVARKEAENAFCEMAKTSSKRVFHVPAEANTLDIGKNSPLVETCQKLLSQVVALEDSAFTSEELSTIGQFRVTMEHFNKFIPSKEELTTKKKFTQVLGGGLNPPFSSATNSSGGRPVVLNTSLQMRGYPDLANYAAGYAAGGTAGATSARISSAGAAALSGLSSLAAPPRVRIVAPKPLHPDVLGGVGLGGRGFADLSGNQSQGGGGGVKPSIIPTFIQDIAHVTSQITPRYSFLVANSAATASSSASPSSSNDTASLSQDPSMTTTTTTLNQATATKRPDLDQSAFNSAMDSVGQNLKNSLSDQLNQHSLLNQQLSQHRSSQIMSAQRDTQRVMQLNPMIGGGVGGAFLGAPQQPHAAQSSMSGFTSNTHGAMNTETPMSMSTMSRLVAAPLTRADAGVNAFGHNFDGGGGGRIGLTTMAAAPLPNRSSGSVHTFSTGSIILGQMSNNDNLSPPSHLSALSSQPSSAQVVEPDQSSFDI